MMSFSAAMDSIQLLGFRSCRMNFLQNLPIRPDPGLRGASSFQNFSFQRFSFTQMPPFFPATSFSPALVPVTGSFMTKGQAFNHDLKIHRAVLS